MAEVKTLSAILCRDIIQMGLRAPAMVDSLDSITDSGVYTLTGKSTDTLPDGTRMIYGKIIQIGKTTGDFAQLFLGYIKSTVAYRFVSNNTSTQGWVILGQIQ